MMVAELSCRLVDKLVKVNIVFDAHVRDALRLPEGSGSKYVRVDPCACSWRCLPCMIVQPLGV